MTLRSKGLRIETHDMNHNKKIRQSTYVGFEFSIENFKIYSNILKPEYMLFLEKLPASCFFSLVGAHAEFPLLALQT